MIDEELLASGRVSYRFAFRGQVGTPVQNRFALLFRGLRRRLHHFVIETLHFGERAGGYFQG